MGVLCRKEVESEDGRVLCIPTRMRKLQSLVSIRESEFESESSSNTSISDFDDTDEKNFLDSNVSEEIEEIPRTATQRFVVDDLMQYHVLRVCAQPKGIIMMSQLPIVIPNATSGMFSDNCPSWICSSQAEIDWLKSQTGHNKDIWTWLAGGYGLNKLWQPKDKTNENEWTILPYSPLSASYTWSVSFWTGYQFTVGYIIGFSLKFPLWFAGVSKTWGAIGVAAGSGIVYNVPGGDYFFEKGMVLVTHLVTTSVSVALNFVQSTAFNRVLTFTLFGNWCDQYRWGEKGENRRGGKIGELTVSEFMQNPMELFHRFNGLMELLWASFRAAGSAHYSCISIAMASLKQVFLLIHRRQNAKDGLDELVKKITEIKLLELCSCMGIGVTWFGVSAMFANVSSESSTISVLVKGVKEKAERMFHNVATVEHFHTGFWSGTNAEGDVLKLSKDYLAALTHVIMDTREGHIGKNQTNPDPPRTWEQSNTAAEIGTYSFGFLYGSGKEVLLGSDAMTPKSWFDYLCCVLKPCPPLSGNPFVDVDRPNSFKHLDEKATLFPGKDVLWFDIPKEWSEQIHGLELDNVLWLHDIMVWIRGGKIAPKETVHMVTGLMQYTPGFMALTRFHWINTLGYGAMLVAAGVMTTRWLRMCIRWRRLFVKVTINLSLRGKIREATEALKTMQNDDPTIKHKVHRMELYESMLEDLGPSLLDADRGQTTAHDLCLIRQGHTRLGMEGLKKYGRWVGQIWTPDMFFRESYLYLRRMFRRIIEQVADWSKPRRGMAAVFAVATMWVASPTLARIIGKDILIEGMFWIARGFFATKTSTVNVGHLQYIHWALKAVAKVFGKTAVGNMVQVIPNMVDMADKQAREMVYALGAGMYYLLYGPPRNASIFNALEPRHAARGIIARSKRGRSLLQMVSASAFDLIHPWTVLKLLWRVGPWRLSILSTIVKMILQNTGTVRKVIQLVSM